MKNGKNHFTEGTTELRKKLERSEKRKPTNTQEYFTQNGSSLKLVDKFTLSSILSVRSDFHMTDSSSIAVHAFSSRILTSFSVDETLLPR